MQSSGLPKLIIINEEEQCAAETQNNTEKNRKKKKKVRIDPLMNSKLWNSFIGVDDTKNEWSCDFAKPSLADFLKHDFNPSKKKRPCKKGPSLEELKAEKYKRKRRICELCSMNFSDFSTHLNHMKTHWERPLSCKFCEKIYPCEKKLRRHLLIHTQEKK